MTPAVTGTRLVLSNVADPAREAEAGRWYDRYARRLADAGALLHGQRFENRRAAGTPADPRILALYDLVTPDPAEAWPQTESASVYPTDMFDDDAAGLVQPAFRSSFALVAERGARFSVAAGHRALLVILSDGGDDTVRAAYARDAIATRVLASAARFRLIEGFPEPPGWLELFDVADPDPATLLDRLSLPRPADVVDRHVAVFTPIPTQENR